MATLPMLALPVGSASNEWRDPYAGNVVDPLPVVPAADAQMPEEVAFQRVVTEQLSEPVSPYDENAWAARLMVKFMQAERRFRREQVRDLASVAIAQHHNGLRKLRAREALDGWYRSGLSVHSVEGTTASLHDAMLALVQPGMPTTGKLGDVFNVKEFWYYKHVPADLIALSEGKWFGEPPAGNAPGNYANTEERKELVRMIGNLTKDEVYYYGEWLKEKRKNIDPKTDEVDTWKDSWTRIFQLLKSYAEYWVAAMALGNATKELNDKDAALEAAQANIKEKQEARAKATRDLQDATGLVALKQREYEEGGYEELRRKQDDETKKGYAEDIAKLKEYYKDIEQKANAQRDAEYAEHAYDLQQAKAGWIDALKADREAKAALKRAQDDLTCAKGATWNLTCAKRTEKMQEEKAQKEKARDEALAAHGEQVKYVDAARRSFMELSRD